MITPEKLEEFLKLKDETPKVEFKLKVELTGQNKSKNQDELAKDLLALVNTAGRHANDYAYLIIGAGDKLKSDGTRDYEDVRPYGFDIPQFLNILNARCDPPVQDIDYDIIELNGKYYGVIELKSSPHIHSTTRNLDTPRGIIHRGSALVRNGSQIGLASFREMQQIDLEKKKLVEWVCQIEDSFRAARRIFSRSAESYSAQTFNYR